MGCDGGAGHIGYRRRSRVRVTAFWGAMTVRVGILRFGAAMLAVLLGFVPSVSSGTIDGGTV